MADLIMQFFAFCLL